MVRRSALAMGRGIAFAGLALAGLLAGVLVFLSFLLVMVGLVFAYLPAVEHTRFLPRLARRLASAWSTVGIADPYLPQPEPVQPGEDGWYRDGNQLYKTGWWLNFQQRMSWLCGDAATLRDHLWMLLNGVVGVVLGLLPVALSAYGLLGLAAPLGVPWYAGIQVSAAPWAAVLLGLVITSLGVLVAPFLLGVQGRWTKLLLGPKRAKKQRSRPREWLRRHLTALGHCVAVATYGFLGFLLFLAHLVILVVSPFLGLNTLVWVPLVEAGRGLPNLARTRVKDVLGAEIPDPYLPEPPPPRQRPDGLYLGGRTLHRTAGPVIRHQRWKWVTSDPATWRDLGWMALNGVVSLPLFAPAVLACIGTFGWVLPWFWEPAIGLLYDPAAVTPGYTPADLLALRETVLGTLPGVVEPILGVLVTFLALLLSLVVLRLYARWNHLLLAPVQTALLAQRVRALTESRAEASDAQAAELRRIERDLHDGAQARLVAMGLKLGAAEALIDRDPTAAKALVAQVREASSTALRELRDLVRGIHPPVLAERGLVDAIRALALDSALDVEVSGELSGRPEAPVESAAYFGVSEVLVNAAKHAHAEHVRIELRHDDGLLRITVTDDGRGGANPSGGSGLRGIERRLANFDGRFTLDSPPGGPTEVTMELPCVLSSPKTSTSSETA